MSAPRSSAAGVPRQPVTTAATAAVTRKVVTACGQKPTAYSTAKLATPKKSAA